MAPQSSDSRHEFVNERSEILSEATDLDVLLAALLDADAAPTAIRPWPRASGEARRDPTLVAPTLVDFSADTDLDLSIVPVAEDKETDAFTTFQAESDEKAFDAPVEVGTLAVLAAPVVGPVPSKGRGDIVPGPIVSPLLLLTGIVVAVLALGAAYFRTDRSDIVVAPSQAPLAPTPVPAAVPVEPPATTATPADLDVTPPRQPTANPRVTTKPLRQSASDRANPVRAEAPALSVASSGASVAPAPLPKAEPPKPISSPTAPTAVTPTVVAGPVEPVTPAPSTVPPPVAKATPARLVTGGPPEYPAEMRTARLGGNVEVRFTVDSRGRVTNVRSVTGPPQLRSVAEAAVRRWRYEPAQLGNVAIDSERSVNFNFDPSARRPQQ